MKLVSTAALAACALVLASGLALSIHSDAFAQANKSPLCYPPIEGVASSQGILGKGSKKARAEVVVAWEQAATAKHGERYGNFKKAKTVKWDCRSGVAEAKCIVTARPCR